MPIVRYNDATIGFPDDMPPEEVQGVLGRAFSNFARDIDTAKTHLSRLAEGSVIVGAVRGMRPEDQAALATSFVPGVGDAAGLYADYTDIRENWDQVPWYDKAGMVGAAALGAVPFVPSRSQVNAGAEVAREKIKAYHGSPTLKNIDDFSLGAPKRTDEGFLGDAMYVSPQEYIAKGYAGESGLVHAVDMPEGKYKDFLYDENYRDTIENFAREIGVTEKPKTPEWAKSFSKKMKDSGYVGARGMNTDGTFAEAAIFQKEKITAYHGSPHEFDKFTTEAIGTGEGAQAYGHGLYFAEAEDVARGYRDDLSKNLIKIPDVDPDVQRQLGDSFAMSDFESVADIPADWWEYQAQGLAEGGFPDLAKQLRNADVSKARLSDGSMYQVEIDASPD